MPEKMELKFKGLMAPVFTAFNDDKHRSVNYDAIPSYAKYIKSKGVHGVLINGTSGEGSSLSVVERKKLTEIWQKVCKDVDLFLMVQIGGAPMVDVIELAIHAECLKVDSILCLPELYFKPKTESDLVDYLQHISEYCPTVPLLYYHIPALTQVNVNLPKFLNLAEESIPSFCGLKYTSNDLDQGSQCLKKGRSVFLGSDTLLSASLALGFESSIMTTLNICPEVSIKIIELMSSGNMDEAKNLQKVLSERVYKILERGEWVTAMKYEYNQLSDAIKMGPIRRPLKDAKI